MVCVILMSCFQLKKLLRGEFFHFFEGFKPLCNQLQSSRVHGDVSIEQSILTIVRTRHMSIIQMHLLFLGIDEYQALYEATLALAQHGVHLISCLRELNGLGSGGRLLCVTCAARCIFPSLGTTRRSPLLCVRRRCNVKHFNNVYSPSVIFQSV
jgi:hypothetical protein